MSSQGEDNGTNDVRVIKRYSNRKLYDVKEKRYITLQEIKELIAEGETIKVIDRDTGEDISRVTLAKILLELENKQKGSLPLGILKDMVAKSQESVSDYVRRSVTATRDAINQIEANTQKQINKIVDRGHMTEKEARNFVQEIVEMAERGRTNLETMLEDHYQQALRNLNLTPHRDVEDFGQRLAIIEARLTKIESFLEAQGFEPADVTIADAKTSPTAEGESSASEEVTAP